MTKEPEGAREAFEADVRATCTPGTGETLAMVLERYGEGSGVMTDRYVLPNINARWMGWQAAVRATTPDCPVCKHDSTVYHCEHCGESWAISDTALRAAAPQAPLGYVFTRELEQVLGGRTRAVVIYQEPSADCSPVYAGAAPQAQPVADWKRKLIDKAITPYANAPLFVKLSDAIAAVEAAAPAGAPPGDKR